MIGIGIDIVRIDRIEKMWNLYREKFLQKIFFDDEIKEALKKGHFISTIAGKFAAKEAFIKAVSGIANQPVPFLSFKVLCDATGKPQIINTENLKIGFPCQKFVSISHEKEYAVAVVVII